MRNTFYAASLVATMIAGVPAASIAQLDAQPNPLAAVSIGSLAQLDAQPDWKTALIRGFTGQDTITERSKQTLLYKAYYALYDSMFRNHEITISGDECDLDNKKTMLDHQQRIAEGITKASNKLARVVDWIDEGKYDRPQPDDWTPPRTTLGDETGRDARQKDAAALLTIKKRSKEDTRDNRGAQQNQLLLKHVVDGIQLLEPITENREKVSMDVQADTFRKAGAIITLINQEEPEFLKGLAEDLAEQFCVKYRRSENKLTMKNYSGLAKTYLHYLRQNAFEGELALQKPANYMPDDDWIHYFSPTERNYRAGLSSYTPIKKLTTFLKDKQGLYGYDGY